MLIYLTALLIVVVDQISKFLALKYLSSLESLPLIKNIFHLTLVKNTGIAFGLFKSDSQPLLIILAFAVFILIVLAGMLRKHTIVIRIGFAFILGGALSNLIDRIHLGYVIDYLDFRIWPVFNLADSFITLGTFLIIVKIVKSK